MKADIAAIRARNEGRRQGRVSTPTPWDDIDVLLDALDDAQAELTRLREEHADLHASATMWANLYSALATRPAPPPHVQQYSELVESINVLREAVEGFLRDCMTCAPWDVARVFDMTPSEMCERCLRAVSALRRAINPGDAMNPGGGINPSDAMNPGGA